jgi:transcriptional regulator with XRE-family HTH domain
MSPSAELPTDRHQLTYLGERLRGIRAIRGLSLQEVAEAAAVSPSFLSLLERGRTDISLIRIMRLANAYGMSLSELLIDGEPRADPPQIESITSASAIERGAGVDYRLIRRDPPQVMYVTLEPGAAFSDLRAHQGEDFWICVSGQVNLLHAGERHLVAAGHTARHSGLLPHGIENPFAERAQLVVVTTALYW